MSTKRPHNAGIIKPLPVVEDGSSLLIYETIIRANRPLTYLELLERGNVSNGSLYPLLQRRVHFGILVDGEYEGSATYDLTPHGYWQVRQALLESGIEKSVLLLADERFAFSRPSSI